MVVCRGTRPDGVPCRRKLSDDASSIDLHHKGGGFTLACDRCGARHRPPPVSFIDAVKRAQLIRTFVVTLPLDMASLPRRVDRFGRRRTVYPDDLLY